MAPDGAGRLDAEGAAKEEKDSDASRAKRRLFLLDFDLQSEGRRREQSEHPREHRTIFSSAGNRGFRQLQMIPDNCK